MNNYLTTFDVPLTGTLAEGQRKDANRAINLHYTGKSFVPMHEKATDMHMDAVYAVHRARPTMTARFGLLPDGSLEFIEIVK